MKQITVVDHGSWTDQGAVYQEHPGFQATPELLGRLLGAYVLGSSVSPLEHMEADVAERICGFIVLMCGVPCLFYNT